MFFYLAVVKLLFIIFRPVFFIYQKIFKPASLQVYIGLFSGKRFWRKFFKNSNNFFHHLVNQKLTLYLILGLIGLLTVVDSLQAKEMPPEELGKKSILFELVAQEGAAELIEDTTLPPIIETKTIQPKDLAITTDGEMIGEDIPQENTLSLTAGGSSLLASGEIATPHTRTSIEEYTVLPGDTVSSIAKQFGISVNSILWSNNLSSYTIIRPGDRLKILPVSGLIYKIEKGDTIAGIAKKYQAEAEDILINNNITEDSLDIGKEIIIPGGVMPKPKVIAPPTRVSVSEIFNPAPATDSDAQLLWPAISHRINQYYSWRHRGIDINGKNGDPIYASETGKVEVAGWNSRGYGNYIIINHGNGIKTLYAHNSKNEVGVGDTVSRGQIIGYIGSTGRSTGPHIHYEVHVNGVLTNPLVYTK